MKALIWAGVLVVSIVIQAAILPIIFTKGGAKPDLILIIVVATGLLNGREQGIGISFFAGVLQDLASGNIFGLNTLSKMATGYVAGLAERKVFKESIVLPVLATCIATVFNSAVMQALLFVLGHKVELGSTLVNQVLPSIGYNVLFCIPIHRFIYKLSFGNRSQF